MPVYLDYFPDQIERMLEFEVVRDLIANYRLSDLSLDFINNIRFHTGSIEIKKLLFQTSEFKSVIDQNLGFPTDNYIDIRESLSLLEIENSTISANDFRNISLVCSSISRILSFFSPLKEKLPYLSSLTENIISPGPLTARIDKVIDDESNVRSNASEKLYDLKKRIIQKENETDIEFNRVYKLAKKNGWLSDQGESFRHGERVLAFLAVHKRKIKGIILDQSSTGKTFFIQPESILDLVNETFELRHAEKREIHSILNQLSFFARDFVPQLKIFQNLMAELDFIRSKALFAIEISASLPEISEKKEIKLEKAFHPLLFRINKQQGKKTIPLDLEINETDRIIVISGPNAGGKSVSLKTTGLLQMMFQAGMLIPASPDSRFGIFKKIFIDIGDNQSIENDLSTYSSHLKNMKFFIEHADSETLFLIDEFGSGTDPSAGGIIAATFLNILNEKKSFGIVTTHYAILKKMASEIPGIKNAAFHYDIKMLKPTYQLFIGMPGSSYSYELLQNIDIEDKILEIIKNNLDSENYGWDRLIGDIHLEKNKIEESKSELFNKENQLNILINKNKYLKQKYDDLKSTVKLEAKEKADEYLFNLNRRFEKIIRDWQNQDNLKRKEGISIIKNKLADEREKLKSEIKKMKSRSQKEFNPSAFSVGLNVTLKNSSSIGTIEKIKNNRAIVIFDHVKTEANLDQLEILSQNIPGRKQKINITTDLVTTHFSPVIDIRGKRKAEAMDIIEVFLDKALIHSFKTLRIIHGTGEGVLRPAIRSLLKKYDKVIDIQSDKPESGGDGITIVTLE